MYACYELTLRHKNMHAKSCVLLEAEAELGGRARVGTFAGTRVPTGAGVGRFEKDARLKRLLKALGLGFRRFRKEVHYANSARDGCAVRDAWKRLRLEQSENGVTEATFKEFALDALGPREYRAFVKTMGYTDMENADVADVLHSYGIDDTFSCGPARHDLMWVDWSALIDALAERIRAARQEIRTGCRVESIVRREDSSFEVTCNSGSWRCRDVVLGVPAGAARQLVRGLVSRDIYRDYICQVREQPFLRVYAQFDAASRKEVAQKVSSHGVTVVENELQKIIPMDPARGVYMIAYCDNRSARTVHEHEEDARWMARKVRTALGLDRDPVITRLQAYYFDAGTHFYAPLVRSLTRSSFVKAAMHPAPGVHLSGEAFSANHQGWVEGALESAEHVVRKLLKK